jgi:hypothetical protein
LGLSRLGRVVRLSGQWFDGRNKRLLKNENEIGQPIVLAHGFFHALVQKTLFYQKGFGRVVGLPAFEMGGVVVEFKALLGRRGNAYVPYGITHRIGVFDPCLYGLADLFNAGHFNLLAQ